MESSRLNKIADLGASVAELLNLAGVEDLSALAAQDAKSLQTRLVTLNERRKILPNSPTQKKVRVWIEKAREHAEAVAEPSSANSTSKDGAHSGEEDDAGASKDTIMDEIETLLASALEAEVVSPRIHDPWESLLPLPQKAGDPPPAPPPIAVPHETPVDPQPGDGDDQKRGGIRRPSPHRIPKKKSTNLGSFKDFDAYEHEHQDEPAREEAPDRDYVSDRKSRRKRRRGITFQRGVRMYFASILAVLLRLIGFATVISLTIGVLFFPDELIWFMIGPAVCAVLGITQLFLIPPLRCRVCGRKLFTPSLTPKNAGAHKYFGFGYISSLAIHTLFKLWFRCQYCATTQRIKN